MTQLRRSIAVVGVLAAVATQAEEPCKPEVRKRLPAAADFARLCPKDPVFDSTPREKGDPLEGCALYFRETPTRFVQVSATRQQPRVSGGAKMGAEKAAEAFGKHGGGRVPVVKRMPWKSVEAYVLEGMPGGYYVGSGGDVLVVSLNAMFAKVPSDACAEAIVRDLAARFAAP